MWGGLTMRKRVRILRVFPVFWLGETCFPFMGKTRPGLFCLDCRRGVHRVLARLQSFASASLGSYSAIRVAVLPSFGFRRPDRAGPQAAAAAFVAAAVGVAAEAVVVAPVVRAFR